MESWLSTCSVGADVPISKMNKLRLGDVQWFSHDHPGNTESGLEMKQPLCRELMWLVSKRWWTSELLNHSCVLPVSAPPCWWRGGGGGCWQKTEKPCAPHTSDYLPQSSISDFHWNFTGKFTESSLCPTGERAIRGTFWHPWFRSKETPASREGAWNSPIWETFVQPRFFHQGGGERRGQQW